MGKPFQFMTKEEVCANAAKGGKAAHAKGTAHVWTSETARAAALKGVAKRRALKAARSDTHPCSPPEMAVHAGWDDEEIAREVSPWSKQ